MNEFVLVLLIVLPLVSLPLSIVLLVHRKPNPQRAYYKYCKQQYGARSRIAQRAKLKLRGYNY
jgi:hypothetical protein